MPRERFLPPPLRTSVDEIQTGDQVLVRNLFLGNERLATVIELREVEEDELQNEEGSSILMGEAQATEIGPATADEGQIAVDEAPSTLKKASAESELISASNNDTLTDDGTTKVGSREEERPPESATSSTAVSDGEPPPKDQRRRMLYYVHYVGIDRRLDEWVDASRIVQAPIDSNAIPPTPNDPFGKTMTRSQRRLNEDFRHVPKSIDDLDATTRKLELEHEERTKVKNVERVQFGEWEIDAWYFSPFPLFFTINRSKIYFCEFCFWYTAERDDFTHHMLHLCREGAPPPGDQIYEDGNLVVFEVRGRTHKDYCQCLCLLSKLFLDHKTLYYDVEGFLFYVLCELDERGIAHPVGHFSKEKGSENNLACIMVLPPYQRNGYGKLLIQISYCLSEREGVVGTPEKPLSDLGKVSYRSYWWWVLIGVLDREQVDSNISVAELSRLSGIHMDDIIETFKSLQLIKYWRGDHAVRISEKSVGVVHQLQRRKPEEFGGKREAIRINFIFANL
uniref:Histone acetyltransferase n=1 Tax=Globodera rostochiensis TaxID=31243 RepID=A0A914HHF4_GLORO